MNNITKKEFEKIYSHDFQDSLCFFGAGTFCKTVLKFFQEENLPLPVAICDNNSSKQGTDILSIPVMSLEEAKKRYKNIVIVITSKLYAQEIYEKLMATEEETSVFTFCDFIAVKHEKTNKSFVSLETLDTLWKESVKERCLSKDKKLSDLLLLNLYYTNKCYYVMDGKKFLGTIDLSDFINLDRSALSSDCTLEEVLGKIKPRQSFSLEEKEAFFNLSQLSLLFSVFSPSTGDELPILEKDSGELLGILDKTTCYAFLAEENYEKELCEFAWKKTANRQDLNLNQYRHNINSQNGEDGVLSYIFDVIGTTSCYAVEFGGWDGIFLSNVRNLIMERGFSGLFIEGVPERAEDGRKNYESIDRVEMVNAFVEFEGENTLDAILDRANTPKEIDIMSIDIDGYDYHVWDALKKYRPRVVIIEHNNYIPKDVLFVNPRQTDVFKGNSAYALVSLGISKGYSLVAVFGCNCIFVLNEELSKFPVFDNSLEALLQDSSSTASRSFQCFDMSLYSLSMQDNYIWNENKPFEGKEFRFITD